MATLTVYNINGEKIGECEASDLVFCDKEKNALLHEVIKSYLANKRQGTKATKSRAEVNGTSKKPWRQKGTGRARAGSQKSPVWVGGGHTFALKPRDFSVNIPKSKRDAALRSAISQRFAENNIKVLEDFNLSAPKTKEMNMILDKLNVNSTAAIVLADKNDNIVKSARNIQGITTVQASDINVLDVVKNEQLIILKSAVAKLEARLAK